MSGSPGIKGEQVSPLCFKMHTGSLLSDVLCKFKFWFVLLTTGCPWRERSTRNARNYGEHTSSLKDYFYDLKKNLCMFSPNDSREAFSKSHLFSRKFSKHIQVADTATVGLNFKVSHYTYCFLSTGTSRFPRSSRHIWFTCKFYFLLISPICHTFNPRLNTLTNSSYTIH